MKMKNKIFILFALIYGSITEAYSQDCNSYLQQATELVSQKKYCDALVYYQKYSDCNADADVSTEIAMCKRSCKTPVPVTAENPDIITRRDDSKIGESEIETGMSYGKDRQSKRKPVTFAASLSGGVANGVFNDYTAYGAIEGYLKLNYTTWYGNDIKLAVFGTTKTYKPADYPLLAENYAYSNTLLQAQYGIACFTVPLGKGDWAFRANYRIGAGYSFDSKKFGFCDDADLGLKKGLVYFGIYRSSQQNVYPQYGIIPNDNRPFISYGIRLGINY
jgi:hypothetical protein